MGYPPTFLLLPQLWILLACIRSQHAAAMDDHDKTGIPRGIDMPSSNKLNHAAHQQNNLSVRLAHTPSASHEDATDHDKAVSIAREAVEVIPDGRPDQAHYMVSGTPAQVKMRTLTRLFGWRGNALVLPWTVIQIDLPF